MFENHTGKLILPIKITIEFSCSPRDVKVLPAWQMDLLTLSSDKFEINYPRWFWPGEMYFSLFSALRLPFMQFSVCITMDITWTGKKGILDIRFANHMKCPIQDSLEPFFLY